MGISVRATPWCNAAASWGNRIVSPAYVLEPTYHSIKRHLLSGHWPMGTKLEAVKLADEIGVSMTPVRDSLNQLYGEQLVDFAPGEGFRVPQLSEGQLRDLINLNLILVTAGIANKSQQIFGGLSDEASYPERVADIFHHLADRCENIALSACVNSISDRLHAVRILDEQLIGDAEIELRDLVSALRSAGTARAMLKGLLPRYHERRVALTREYIRLLSGK